jgi:hypothetical protein
LKQFIDRHYPTFAALAPLREIFRVSVALWRQVFRGGYTPDKVPTL